MTWKDDVLASYEQKREKSDSAQWIASQRRSLLENGHQGVWNTLRGVVSKLCTELNEKAGRDILKSTDPRANYLSIDREDRQKLKAEYDPKTQTVRFESDAFLFGKHTYQVSVRPAKGGMDGLVWIALENKNSTVIDDPNEIAQAVLKNFLEAGHEHL
jgi:hypothetical protein